MKILIPSYQRFHRGLTLLERLPDRYLKNTYICVREQELLDYKKVVNPKATIVPLHKSTDMMTTRNEMVSLFDGKVVMIDDDCYFREYDGERYTTCGADSIGRMLDELCHILESGFVHASIAHPIVGSRLKGKLAFNTRYYAVLAYDLSVIKKLGIKFRTKTMSDIEVALQLTKLGYPSAIITHWLIETHAQNSGGCSVYRTSEMHNRCAKKIAKTYFPYVKAKQAQSWKGMEKRIDIMASWKRLFASAKIQHIPKGYDVIGDK